MMRKTAMAEIVRRIVVMATPLLPGSVPGSGSKDQCLGTGP